MEPLRHPLERRPLHERRDDDDEEDGVEDRVAGLHPCGERERREHDGDRPTQTRPSEQHTLARREVEGDRRRPHRDRPDQEHEKQRQREPGQHHRGQFVREDEEAEDDEQSDLGDEREPFVEADELPPVARRGASDSETDEVDGEEAAPPDHVRESEREPDCRQRRKRSKRPE